MPGATECGCSNWAINPAAANKALLRPLSPGNTARNVSSPHWNTASSGRSDSRSNFLMPASACSPHSLPKRNAIWRSPRMYTTTTANPPVPMSFSASWRPIAVRITSRFNMTVGPPSQACKIARRVDRMLIDRERVPDFDRIAVDRLVQQVEHAEVPQWLLVRRADHQRRRAQPAYLVLFQHHRDLAGAQFDVRAGGIDAEAHLELLDQLGLVQRTARAINVLQGFVARHRRLKWTGAAHRIVGIDDRQHAARHRNGVVEQAVRIAAAVEAFMVGAHDIEHVRIINAACRDDIHA